MGQLSARLAVLLEKYGADPAAHQAELHQLAALEGTNPKEALERFHELKRAAAERHRGELLHRLRSLGFVTGVPDHGTRGMDAKELEREIRQFTRALSHARDLAESVEETRALSSKLGEREASWDPAAFARVAFDDLARVSEIAEAARRALAREARVHARAEEVRKRARKLSHVRVEAPDVSSARMIDASDADRALEAAESALAAAERVEAAYERAMRPLRDPAVSRWKGNTRKRLADEAARLLAARDAPGLDALAPVCEAARVDAARLAEEATRARRSGRGAPQAERRAGDTLDGYG